MLTLLLMIAFIFVFGGVFKFAFAATWGLTKFIVTLILLPLMLVGMILSGLIAFAVPILLILLVVGFFVEA